MSVLGQSMVDRYHVVVPGVLSGAMHRLAACDGHNLGHSARDAR
jgi:hypothetical protein